MRYSESAAPPALAGGIASIWELEAAGTPLNEPIFPDGRIEVILHLGARPRVAGQAATQPALMVVGQMTAALRLEQADHMHAVGIRFTPAGARAWLAVPLHQLSGQVLALEDVAPRLARAVTDALGEGRGLQPARDRLTAALLATRGAKSSSQLAAAVDAALKTGGDVDVDRLARHAGLSARQLERQFLDGVGLSPKRFLRTTRFQRALAMLRGGHAPVEVAARCGYADQPHLAREFRAFAGVPARKVKLEDVAFLT